MSNPKDGNLFELVSDSKSFVNVLWKFVEKLCKFFCILVQSFYVLMNVQSRSVYYDGFRNVKGACYAAMSNPKDGNFFELWILNKTVTTNNTLWMLASAQSDDNRNVKPSSTTTATIKPPLLSRAF